MSHGAATRSGQLIASSTLALARIGSSLALPRKIRDCSRQAAIRSGTFIADHCPEDVNHPGIRARLAVSAHRAFLNRPPRPGSCGSKSDAFCENERTLLRNNPGPNVTQRMAATKLILEVHRAHQRHIDGGGRSAALPASFNSSTDRRPHLVAARSFDATPVLVAVSSRATSAQSSSRTARSTAAVSASGMMESPRESNEA